MSHVSWTELSSKSFFGEMTENEKLLVSMITATEDGCWNWIGYKNKKGRCQIFWNGRMTWAAHVVREVLGLPKTTESLLRSCDNPDCVSPNHILPTTEMILSRIAVKESGCHEYTGRRTDFGYGIIGIDGGVVKLHRWFYERANGPIPEGMCVLHSCDNPPCCNPAHLRIGTQQENMRDVKDRKRSHSYAHPESINYGEDVHNSKLTDAQAVEIRFEVAKNELSYRQIGEKYGLDWSTVQNISSGKSWQHVVGPITARGKGTKPTSYVTPQGAGSHAAKVTEADVLEIRRLWAVEKTPHSEISSRFGLDKTTISDICRFKTWQNVGGERLTKEESLLAANAQKKKLSADQINEIKQLASSGEISKTDLERRFSICRKTLNRALNS